MVHEALGLHRPRAWSVDTLQLVSEVHDLGGYTVDVAVKVLETLEGILQHIILVSAIKHDYKSHCMVQQMGELH